MQNNLAPKRKHLLLILSLLFLLAGAGYLAYWLLYGQFFESTDDAYVSGNLVQVMPQVTSNVVSIYADETDLVHSGQTLLQLDGMDAQIAPQKAEARLAQAVRNVRQLFDVAKQARADVEAMSSRLVQAKADLVRRQDLISDHAVSREELEHANENVVAAQAELDSARHRLEAANAAVANTTVRTNPAVLGAEAEVREAWLARRRNTIDAPVTGYVAKRSAELGQRVTPTTPLMNIVPLDEIWVDANFKEDQLRHIRIGQPVTLGSDFYGTTVKFHGSVLGLGAGTGSVFSLLPAQNATGNWIKVVQRLPVRIKLDPKEIEQHPLRIGLSMVAEVDTSDQSGDVLSRVQRHAPIYSTAVFEKGYAEAERMIEKILTDNQ
jgi:membrane fusion protein (multidrug efflux system)